MISKKINIVAYHLGEKIYIEKFKAIYDGSIYSSTTSEIYIQLCEYSFIYVQNDGEVAFSDCDETTILKFIALLKRFVHLPSIHGVEYKEDFMIEVNPDQVLHFGYNSIQIPELSPDAIKIVLLNISQSVVLDYFSELSQNLLFETSAHAKELELKGKLTITKAQLLKFIGRTLGAQNRIIDNLYFLDAPDTVWDVEYLSQINLGLSRVFKLKTRFKEIEYTLKIIENNLNAFTQLTQHRESKKLDHIIILLIFFEILYSIFKS